MAVDSELSVAGSDTIDHQVRVRVDFERILVFLVRLGNRNVDQVAQVIVRIARLVD